MSGKLRAVDGGLRCGNRGIWIAHVCHGDEAAFQHHLRLDAKERRLPNHEVREFARLDGADLVRNPMRDRGLIVYLAT